MASKVALVTASSAGLGAATAKALASSGFRTVINYNSNREKADALVREIVESRALKSDAADGKPYSVAVQGDLFRRDNIIRLVDTAVSTMGRLDVVVSNQGWTRMRRFDDLDDNMDETDWDLCFHMNVKSHLFLFHAARPHLAHTHGSFTTVASLAGVVPSGSSLAYSVTKAAQIHLARGLAKIASPEIRVNTVSPGILLTEWGMKFPAAKLDAARDKSALKRLAEIDDVVRQILVLALGQSSTGVNVVIDAGWSIS